MLNCNNENKFNIKRIKGRLNIHQRNIAVSKTLNFHCQSTPYNAFTEQLPLYAQIWIKYFGINLQRGKAQLQHNSISNKQTKRLDIIYVAFWTNKIASGKVGTININWTLRLLVCCTALLHKNPQIYQIKQFILMGYFIPFICPLNYM